MSDTPRTDEAIVAALPDPINDECRECHFWEMVEHSRQLERELAEANRLVNHWQDQHSHATECHGATIRELADMTAKRDALEDCLARLRDCDFVITPHDRMDAVREIAREAIAAHGKNSDPQTPTQNTPRTDD